MACTGTRAKTGFIHQRGGDAVSNGPWRRLAYGSCHASIEYRPPWPTWSTIAAPARCTSATMSAIAKTRSRVFTSVMPGRRSALLVEARAALDDEPDAVLGVRHERLGVALGRVGPRRLRPRAPARGRARLRTSIDPTRRGECRLGIAVIIVVGRRRRDREMMTTTRIKPVVTIGVVLALMMGAVTTTAATTVGRSAPRGVPPEVRDHADDWPVPGQDYGNARTAASSPIDASNVTRLEEAWTVELDGGASTAPLVVGDTVYMQDTRSNVRAVDRATGSVRWTRELDSFTIGPHGVAVGWGSVFATTGTGAVALDAATGEIQWERQLTKTETEGVDIQPVAFGRRVLASTVPVSISGQFVGGDRGVISALDAKTGDTAWSFDTVKSDDLWGNPEINSGGGAWYAPSIDVRTGMSYWGTGNPSPFAGTQEFPNGSSRPGPNLYTESTVALPIRDGKLRWYYQAHPHDLIDRDFVHTMVIDVTTDGETRTLVVGAGKGGVIFGFDPRTGKRLWKATVGEHENDELRRLSGPTKVLPGDLRRDHHAAGVRRRHGLRRRRQRADRDRPRRAAVHRLRRWARWTVRSWRSTRVTAARCGRRGCRVIRWVGSPS